VGNVQALVRLLDRYAAHPVERKRMGEAGKQRFTTKFHVNRIAEETLHLYNEILS